MKVNSTDFSGRKIGYLEVVGPCKNPGSKHKGRYWLCRCACGTEKPVPQVTLANSNDPSCGCHSQDHAALGGLSMRHRKEYLIYRGMLNRCKNHDDYCGRGIIVCDHWQGIDGFANFLADMGSRPSPKHEIDRRDNDGPYSPENCRWVTRAEQMRNTRRNVFLTHEGITLCVSDWATKLGIHKNTLDKRVKAGWPVGRILDPNVSERHSKNSAKRKRKVTS